MKRFRRSFAVTLIILSLGFISFSQEKSEIKKTKREDRSAAAIEKIKNAKRLLVEAKSALTREGKYKCCLEVPCNQCALDHQSCPCYTDLKEGKPVCPECYGGWQRGEGKDKTINPSDVKTKFSEHRH